MRFAPIAVLQVRPLRGPSIWTYKPVIEFWVDIGELEDYPSNTVPGFVDRLLAWLPSLQSHRCNYGVEGGFVQRLNEGTWPAHILEHLTLELQNLAGLPGGFGRARDGDRRGVYKVVVRAWHEDVTRAAFDTALRLLMAAYNNDAFDLAPEIENLRELAEDSMLGPSTACIVNAASDLDIPAIRLADNNLVQLGYGARQRRIWTAETDATSAIAEGISRDKALTKSLLMRAGLSVPEGETVSSEDEAWEVAQGMGGLAVVKPLDANHGRGVFIGLSSEAEVRSAYRVAEEEGSGVMVERFIPGHEHRLLVVGGRMVAAARGEIAMVQGDGKSSVAELIESQLNRDPRRGTREEHPLNPIRIDSAVTLELDRQGLGPESIPRIGQTVLIQRAGNMSEDITHLVHPEVAADVVLAAQVVGLDVAGIDLVAEDISQPLPGQRGAIVEVNAGPGLLMHLKPASGQAQPVGEAIVRHLFPDVAAAHLPIVGVSGSRGKTLTANLLASLLRLETRTVGIAQRWAGGRRLLLSPQIQAAIIENGGRSILEEGLSYERCDVGIVMGVDADITYPDFAMSDAESLTTVFRTQVDVVRPEGAAVLDADEPISADLGQFCDGEVIYFTLADPRSHSRSQPILQAGGRAVGIRGGSIVFASGPEAATDVVGPSIDDLPLAQQGPQQIRSILAAASAAWAIRLDLSLLATGLRAWRA